MKNILKRFVVIVLAGFLMAGIGCMKGGSGKGGRLDVQEFAKLLSSTPNAQLIDVRTEEEFQKGHLRNARLISLNNNDFQSQATSLDKDKPVFVYCLSGGRSSSAAGMLRNMGFKTVYEMPGIMAWTAEGLEVVTDETLVPASSISLTPEAYLQLVNEKGYTLVDFSAPWCQPCKIISPILDKLAVEYAGKMNLRKLDADEQADLLKAKGIDGIPYLELYKDGKLVWEHKGLVNENEIRKQIK